MRAPAPKAGEYRITLTAFAGTGATGPADCGLVYLVRGDPELRERLRRIRAGEDPD